MNPERPSQQNHSGQTPEQKKLKQELNDLFLPLCQVTMEGVYDTLANDPEYVAKEVEHVVRFDDFGERYIDFVQNYKDKPDSEGNKLNRDITGVCIVYCNFFWTEIEKLEQEDIPITIKEIERIKREFFEKNPKYAKDRDTFEMYFPDEIQMKFVHTNTFPEIDFTDELKRKLDRRSILSFLYFVGDKKNYSNNGVLIRNNQLDQVRRCIEIDRSNYQRHIKLSNEYRDALTHPENKRYSKTLAPIIFSEDIIDYFRRDLKDIEVRPSKKEHAGFPIHVGEYGEDFAKKLAITTHILYELALEHGYRTAQIIARDHQQTIKEHTARGMRSDQHTFPAPMRTMLESIDSLKHTLCLLMAQKVEGLSANELLEQIIDQGIPNAMASMLPMGYISPMFRGGLYFPAFDDQLQNGRLKMNRKFIQEITKLRNSINNTTYYKSKTNGCPVSLRGERNQSGVDMIGESFMVIYRKVSANFDEHPK